MCGIEWMGLWRASLKGRETGNRTNCMRKTHFSLKKLSQEQLLMKFLFGSQCFDREILYLARPMGSARSVQACSLSKLFSKMNSLEAAH